MKTSDSIELISAALVAMQAESKHANYDSKNPHYKSKYASLAEVIDTVRPVLAKHGLAVLQLPGFRPDVGHVMCTRIVHTSGQWIEEEMKLNPTKEDPQGLGSSITYSRRYSLPGVCLIASEEDDDGNEASRPVTPTAQSSVAPKIDQEAVKKRLEGCQSPEDISKLWSTLGITKSHDDYASLVTLFTARKVKITELA